MKNSIVLLSVLILGLSPLISQVQPPLFQQLAQLDSAFFGAFNQCDVEAYGSFLADDYEFYHDKQGLTPSKEAELASMAIFCGEQRERQPLFRELVPGSLKVFPMNQYGALVTGEHLFYLVIDAETRKSLSRAKYSTLWKFEQEAWKITRTLSYDHQPEPEYPLEHEALQRFEGNYQAADRIIKISKEGPLLRMTDLVKGKEVWSAELLPEAENLFYLNIYNIQVEFLKTGEEITQLRIYENGKQIEEVPKIK